MKYKLKLTDSHMILLKPYRGKPRLQDMFSDFSNSASPHYSFSEETKMNGCICETF